MRDTRRLFVVMLTTLPAPPNTYVETRAGSPNATLQTDDGGLGDLARTDEVGVDVSLPRHDCRSMCFVLGEFEGMQLRRERKGRVQVLRAQICTLRVCVCVCVLVSPKSEAVVCH